MKIMFLVRFLMMLLIYLLVLYGAVGFIQDKRFVCNLKPELLG